jgi:hypothetical protein
MFAYGVRYVSLGVMWYLMSNFFPLIFSLLICSDVMRRARQRIFEEIQRADANRVIGPVGEDVAVGVGVGDGAGTGA